MDIINKIKVDVADDKGNFTSTTEMIISNYWDNGYFIMEIDGKKYRVLASNALRAIANVQNK